MIGEQAKQMAAKLRESLKHIPGPHFCVINDHVLEFITELETIDGVVTVPTSEVPDGHCYFYPSQEDANGFIAALKHLRELCIPWDIIQKEIERGTNETVRLS